MKRFSRSYALIAGVLSLWVAEVATGQQTVPVGMPPMLTASGIGLPIVSNTGAVLNWRQFSIGANEVTRFIQQSSSSSVLNRVTGTGPTTTLGNLQSNGRVFLLNPNGILFGANMGAPVGVIEAGKTLEISDPRSPGITVEIKASADRAVNAQQLVDSLGKRDITSALMTNAGVRSATMVVRDEAGRLMLKAAQ